MQAEKHTAEEKTSRIFIEVKNFYDSLSQVHQLHLAVGQYVVYRAILRRDYHPPEIYLAVSNTAFSGILNEEIGILARAEIDMKLVIIDEETETIAAWIH